MKGGSPRRQHADMQSFVKLAKTQNQMDPTFLLCNCCGVSIVSTALIQQNAEGEQNLRVKQYSVLFHFKLLSSCSKPEWNQDQDLEVILKLKFSICVGFENEL